MWVWTLEQFEKSSGRLVRRLRIDSLADDDVLNLIDADELGVADLFDVPSRSLDELSRRTGFDLDQDLYYYLLGREGIA